MTEAADTHSDTLSDTVVATEVGSEDGPLISLTIEAHHCDNRVGYLVTFEAATASDAEAAALAYIDDRSSTHAFHEAEQAPLDDRFQTLLARFYPLCVHGGAEWLCAHPIYHYPPDL